jgi:hypothetical protein
MEKYELCFPVEDDEISGYVLEEVERLYFKRRLTGKERYILGLGLNGHGSIHAMTTDPHLTAFKRACRSMGFEADPTSPVQFVRFLCKNKALNDYFEQEAFENECWALGIC